jgi:hypothetical protein
MRSRMVPIATLMLRSSANARKTEPRSRPGTTDGRRRRSVGQWAWRW